MNTQKVLENANSSQKCKSIERRCLDLHQDPPILKNKLQRLPSEKCPKTQMGCQLLALSDLGGFRAREAWTGATDAAAALALQDDKFCNKFCIIIVFNERTRASSLKPAKLLQACRHRRLKRPAADHTPQLAPAGVWRRPKPCAVRSSGEEGGAESCGAAGMNAQRI